MIQTGGSNNLQQFFKYDTNSWQGRIQRKFEGGAVGSGGAEKFSKLMTRVRYIQQFQIHFRNKQHKFQVILEAN